jgi:hypothetical protein
MEHMRDYELKAFFAYVIEVLERLEIPYMVVGGFAAIFYGEPRLTIDVDIVVNMGWKHINPLVAAFPIPDYYVSEEGIRDSLQRCYPFNVIQPTTGARLTSYRCRVMHSPARPFNIVSGWSTTKLGTQPHLSRQKILSWQS